MRAEGLRELLGSRTSQSLSLKVTTFKVAPEAMINRRGIQKVLFTHNSQKAGLVPVTACPGSAPEA
jgi:hypothetical protein